MPSFLTSAISERSEMRYGRDTERKGVVQINTDFGTLEVSDR